MLGNEGHVGYVAELLHLLLLPQEQEQWKPLSPSSREKLFICLL